MAECGSGKSGKARRARRRFSDEFKAGAVAQVLKEGGSIAQVANLVEGGERISRRRVARLTREQRLAARKRKRYRLHVVPENEQPVAANVLARRFDAVEPNQRSVRDTSEPTTPGGRLFLAALLDLHSRMVVGWATSAVNDPHLVMRAPRAALQHPRPHGDLLRHGDQGSPSPSDDEQRLLRHNGLRCSMSRRGSCYDNAEMESFFSTVKLELGERFESHADAKTKLLDYIEVFFNQQRRHLARGNMSTARFERMSAKQAAAS